MHGRWTTKRLTYFESNDDSVKVDLFRDNAEVTVATRSHSTCNTTNSNCRRGVQAILSDEDDSEAKLKRYSTRNQEKKSSESLLPSEENGINNGDDLQNLAPQRINQSSSRRITRKSQRQLEDEDGYETLGDADAHGYSEDKLDAAGPKTYSFRRRTKQINYSIPPPIEEWPTHRKLLQDQTKGKQEGPDGVPMVQNCRDTWGCQAQVMTE